MNRKLVSAALAVTFMTSACATDNNGKTSNEGIGTVLGAVGGALVGSAFGKGNGKIAAILAGAAIGGIIGNRIGASLDEDEKLAMANATQQAAENARTGERVEWSAPDQPAASPEARASVPVPQPEQPQQTAQSTTAKPQAKTTQTASAQTTSGNKARGWIIPKSDPVRTADGRTCRDVEQGVEKNGKTDVETVTMCRQQTSDGTRWVLPS